MNHLLFHCTSNKSIVLKDGIRETKKVSINGKATYIRTGGTINYYILCVVDTDGTTVDPSTFKFQLNQEVPGFVPDMDAPCTDKKTGEPNGMYFVKAE